MVGANVHDHSHHRLAPAPPPSGASHRDPFPRRTGVPPVPDRHGPAFRDPDAPGWAGPGGPYCPTMTSAVAAQLLGIVAVVGLGYLAVRLGQVPAEGSAPALSAAAFTIFVPALLFRTAAGLDLARLPWPVLGAFFVPALAWLFAAHAVQRLRGSGPPPAAAVRALSVTFGNAVQVGIPVAAAVFGTAGLQVHVAIIGLHVLVLLTAATALAETDLAGARGGTGAGARFGTVVATARGTLVHPVVLPVLAGLGWNLLAGRLGWRLPAPVDGVLALLGQAVAPVCLVLIGVSLAHYGARGHLGGAVRIAAAKLLGLPIAVLLAGHWVFGVTGTPLRVAVVCAALPVGSNPLLFAQRYRVLEGRTTAAVVVSTLAFAVTLPAWLVLLSVLDW